MILEHLLLCVIRFHAFWVQRNFALFTYMRCAAFTFFASTSSTFSSCSPVAFIAVSNTFCCTSQWIFWAWTLLCNPVCFQHCNN
uniref:Uncharacterized protein n=1 Tax=Lepeophtheirus salmonis TaxID=72036 RepID=A0A0K2VGV6_LEPSM